MFLRVAVMGMVFMSAGACRSRDAAQDNVRAIAPRVLDIAPPMPEMGRGVTVVSGLNANAVVVRSDLAYVANTDGVVVLTLGAPPALGVVASVHTPGNAEDLALVGETLLVADGRRGVTMFSLQDPRHPQFVKQDGLPGECQRVVASSKSAAVLCSGGMVALVSPTEPPALLALQGEPRGAAWIGDALYVASLGEGLVRIKHNGLSWGIQAIDSSLRWGVSLSSLGSRLWMGTRDKRLIELDASEPTTRSCGEIALPHRATRLDIGGAFLLAAAGTADDAGATLVSIAVRGKPQIAASLPGGIVAGAPLENASWLFARGVKGFSWMNADLKSPPTAELAGGSFDRALVLNDLVLAWETDKAFGIVQSIHAPQPSGGGTLPFSLHDAAACDGAWCTIENTKRVCRRSLLLGEPICTDLPEGASALAFQAKAHTLWVIDGSSALRGFAVDGEFRPIATVPRPPMLPQERLSRLVVQGERAVAIEPSFGQLQVFELGAAPTRRGLYLLQAKATDVALMDDLAFVAEPTAGLQVIDIHDQDKPREVAWLPLSPGPTGVAVRRAANGLEIALARGEAGVSMALWGADKRLSVISQSDTTGLAMSVAFSDAGLFVADSPNLMRFVDGEARP